MQDVASYVSRIDWMMGRGAMDAPEDDMRCLAGVLTHRCSDGNADPRLSLGLDPQELAMVLRRWFPQAMPGWQAGHCFAAHVRHQRGQPRPCRRQAMAAQADLGHSAFTLTLMEQEEADLCQLFMDHRRDGGVWPTLFARLVSRACMEPEHLWVSLGLGGRQQLTGILTRHFPSLAARNTQDMRWKKFFYKVMCDDAQVWTCTSSSCEICAHHEECYAPESAPAS